ncbi:MAG TPA: DUF1932 domain-containing protein [Gammaproteobacteria bacterium]
MAAATVGLIGTGDMGSAVGAALVAAGYEVITDLSERSAHSRRLAEIARLTDVQSLRAVVERADLILSIVPPAAAPAVAERVADAMSAAGRRPVFADCNAVSPSTARAIARLFDPEAFIDAGIVGRAPRARVAGSTRVYASGEARAALLGLAVPELALIDMGPEVGRASAIKMMYASLNKGTDALHAAALLAAERLGVRAELMEELERSQKEALRRMTERVPFMAAVAERFVGEMHEIAATYESAGLTPDFHRGAAWLFERLAATPLARETRAAQPAQRSLDEALAVFVAALPGT